MGNWAKQARIALGQRNYTQAGDFYKLEGDYKAAIKAYMKGKNLEEAARMYESIGKMKKAEKILQKNGKPKPIAEFHVRHNNLQRATEIYLDNGMDYEAAELLENANQLHQAAELYEKLKFHEQAGVLYRKTRNFLKAIEMFSMVVEELSHSSDPTVNSKIAKYKDRIANLHIGAKQFRAAGLIFEQLQQKEKAAKCYYKGGSPVKAARLLAEMGKLVEDQKILQHVQSREGRLLLGQIAMTRGAYQEAVRYLLETDQSEMLSEAFEHLGKYQEAAFHLEKIGELKKSAAMYSRAGDYQKAAILFEQNGHYEDAAQNYEKQQKFDLAAKLYQLGNNPYKAGFCFHKIKRYDEALKLLQSLDEHHPNRQQANGIMAEIFFKQGMFPVARKLLEDLTSQLTLEDATMHRFYLLARCLEEEGDLRGAQNYYERIAAKKFDYRDVNARLKHFHKGRLTKKPVHAHALPEISPYEVTVGDVIADRFKILSTIGKGGMGFIFKVRDLSLDRDIALKMLIHEKGDFEELKVELLIARDLTHPYIIKVFDVGLWQKIGYFTMEYVDGQSLKAHILDNSPPSLQQKIELLIKICEGMKAAHLHEVVHRDIKPQNILVDKQFNPKILDFGIARKVTQNSQKKGISGSPKYMAPEQIKNLNIDMRTDIYALGIIMFYMFTQKEPFVGRTPQEVMLMHLETALPDPQQFNADVPYWLCEIIKRCCQKNPDMRYNDMEELINELKLNLVDFYL